MRTPVWTASNLLSLSRIVLVIPLAVLLAEPTAESRRWAFALVVIAMLTDLLDGLLARKLNQVTDVGKVIDPLADKIAVATVALILVFHKLIPLWFFLFVGIRDAVILLGGLYVRNKKGIILQSTPVGKWAVMAVATYILVVILGIGDLLWLEQSLMAVAVAMLLLSSVIYGHRFINILHD